MPKGQLKASVVVPVFNTEQYLHQCIQSLLNQTQTDFEIIIVDDASTGSAKAIVESFQPVQPEIKYFRHASNLGALCARFTGIDHSSGDYVGFLDSDDTAKPQYVERLLAAAQESGADIVGSAKNDKSKGIRFSIEGAEALLKAYADKQIPNWSIWTKLYRKELVLSLNELRHFAETERLSKAEDLLFNIFCALKGPKYANIPDALVEYTRGRTGSITNPDSPEQRRKTFQSAVRAYEIMREAASGFEGSVDEIISASAKNAYRSTLTSGDKHEFAWACNTLTRSSVGSVVMAAMFVAADGERRQLARKQSIYEAKIGELRRKLSQARNKSDQWRGKAAAWRTKFADTQQLLREERRRRQKLRAILADLLGWLRKAIRA